MAIADDLSVGSNGDIRWVGTTGSYTVLELHRFLQDLADNPTASGDDLLDITSPTPSDRSTDNIVTLLGNFNINDATAEHFYDGSISQASGATVYYGLVVVGSTNSASTELQIIQNNTLLTSFWGTGLNADAASSTLLRIMVKARDGGADIDGRRIRVQARELGDTYAEFGVTLNLGNSVAAISTQSDLNNQTVVGTIATWTDIVNIEGYQTIDLNNGNGDRPYYSEWDLGTRLINNLYERTKWIQRRGSSETIHGISGELFRGITHSFNYDNESGGPFTEDEILSWGTGASAGTGLLLALDDGGATGTFYIQLLTGVVPSDNAAVTGGISSATADADGSATAQTVSPAFIGSSTGSAIIGAYGIGVQAADLTSSDLLTDLSGTAQTPPNNAVFNVTSLVVGEDYVLVAPESGGAIDSSQLTAAAGNSAGNATLVVNEAIPSDTPVSGVVRAFNGSFNEELAYTSFSGSTFTLSGTLPNAIAQDAGVWIAYIDKLATATTESFTVVYSADRPLFVRVRDGGSSPIKTFETPATLTSSGGSVAAIRTSDA